jgi:transposase
MPEAIDERACATYLLGAKLIENRGCQLLYLPPYSPDLNPIEEAFSKVKRLLRGVGPRTREVLGEVIGKALNRVSAKDFPFLFLTCSINRPMTDKKGFVTSLRARFVKGKVLFGEPRR